MSLPRILLLALGLAAVPFGAQAVEHGDISKPVRHAEEQPKDLPGPFVTDLATGFAIEGFDPVGYFTEHEPMRGKAGFEFAYGGTYWQFSNEGNLAAFTAAPDVFAPRFGGNCVVSLARGITARGRPRLFAIYQGKLYLFHNEGNRQVFLRDPGGFVEQAEVKWPSLKKTLSY